MRNRLRGRTALVVGGGMLLGSFLFGAVDAGTAGSAEPESVPPATIVDSIPQTTPVTGQAEPQPSPQPSVDSPSRRGPIVIHAVGDVALDPDYITDFRRFGFAHAFGQLDGLFESDDLTIFNLECTPSSLGTPLDKRFVFRCPPSALAVARANGVDVVNLANNHSQDFGKTAMLDGLLQSRLAGLEPVGVGADLAGATTPAIIDVGGWKVAVLGMGGVLPGEIWLATDGRPGMASGDDVEQMTAAVRAAADVADLVFVTIHWGVEGEAAPRADDRARAVAMIDAGADAIFGHHPHRLGALELVNGVPVYWTLGNFIWPRLSDASATSGVARIEVDAAGAVQACLLPAFIERSGQPSLTGARGCGQAP